MICSGFKPGLVGVGLFKTGLYSGLVGVGLFTTGLYSGLVSLRLSLRKEVGHLRPFRHRLPKIGP